MSLKHYYVGINSYGINFTYDCDGWEVLRFHTMSDRETWLETHSRNVDTGNIVAEAITDNVAKRIMNGRSWDEYYRDTYTA